MTLLAVIDWTTLGVSAIVGLTASIGVYIKARIDGKQRRQEKVQDWKRQDDVAAAALEAAETLTKRSEEVATAAQVAAATLARRTEEAAAQAREAASLLQASQEETRLAAEEVARIAAASAASTDLQLKQIHKLVNSDMTVAREGELEKTRQLLSALERIAKVEADNGREIKPDDRDLMLQSQARITELEEMISYQHRQQELAEAEFQAAQAEMRLSQLRRKGQDR